MSSLEEIRTHLRKGRIEAVEEVFLDQLEDLTDDIGLFASIARGLIGAGEDERAILLLELLDEKLAVGDRDELRLTLLRATGDIRFAPADEHAAMLALLERIYADSEAFAGLVETVGLHRAIDDRLKNWDKADRLRSLLRYDLGAVVMMEGRGVGEVVEVNTALRKFKVEFHGHGGLRVGFAAAAKLLTPLASGHVLRRKLERPEELLELAGSQPSELLHEVLASYEQALTGTEIRQILSGIVTPEGWSSWWSAARKHPQVVMHSGGRPTYSWAASADHALAGLTDRFAAADLPGKIEVYRQAAGRNAGLKQSMGTGLAAESNRLVSSDPAAALAVYHMLERTGGPLASLDWSPADLVGDAATAADLLQRVDDRQHRELLVRTIATACDDWAEVFSEYLPIEENPRILDFLAGELEARDAARLEKVLSRVLSQPQLNPAAFVWLAERAADDAEIRERVAFRLLQQMVRALSLEVFRPHRLRLLEMFDSGGTVPRLIPLLDRRTAAQAEEAIGRSASLEDFRREPLVTAIHLRFPELRQEEQASIYALPESISRRRQQLKELLEIEIPANRKAIEVAREMGDLRENFEYKAARQRHEYLAARASGLNAELERARPIDLASIDPAEVRIGCRVEVEENGERRRLTILGPWESLPEEGIISYESELGSSLLGCKTGDHVELGGSAAQIVAIEVWEPS